MSSRIKVTGSKDGVEEISYQVRKLLNGAQTKLAIDLEHEKRTEGAPRYLQMLSEQEIQYPHWWTFTKRKSDSPPINTIQLNSREEIFQEVSSILLKTWDVHNVGLGTDAVCLTHSKIQIRNIWRVENPDLYQKYGYCQKLLCKAAISNAYLSIDDLSRGSDIRTRMLTGQMTLVFINRNLNIAHFNFDC